MSAFLDFCRQPRLDQGTPIIGVEFVYIYTKNLCLTSLRLKAGPMGSHETHEFKIFLSNENALGDNSVVAV
jgi:hypothetical protein